MKVSQDMTKVSRRFVEQKRFNQYVNNLWSAFTLMDSKSDIRLLFKDLFTHTEYKMFAKRLEIARRLIEGLRYEDIEKDLCVTTATISAISNVLSEKGEGYRIAHGNLTALEKKYLNQQRSYMAGLANPFKKKTQRRTVLGTALKIGMAKLDKTISKKLKQRTAKETLKI